MSCPRCGGDIWYIGDDTANMPPNVSDVWLCSECDTEIHLNGWVWRRPDLEWPDNRTEGLWKLIPLWHRYWRKHGTPKEFEVNMEVTN